MPYRNSPQSEAWRRHALFAISLVMMGIGVFSSAGGKLEAGFYGAVCLKVGLVLFMLWLALPQLEKLNYWAVIPVLVAAVVAVVRPQLILVAARVLVPLAPVLFMIWLFWIPKKSKPRSR